MIFNPFDRFPIFKELSNALDYTKKRLEQQQHERVQIERMQKMCPNLGWRYALARFELNNRQTIKSSEANTFDQIDVISQNLQEVNGFQRDLDIEMSQVYVADDICQDLQKFLKLVQVGKDYRAGSFAADHVYGRATNHTIGEITGTTPDRGLLGEKIRW